MLWSFVPFLRTKAPINDKLLRLHIYVVCAYACVTSENVAKGAGEICKFYFPHTDHAMFSRNFSNTNIGGLYLTESAIFPQQEPMSIGRSLYLLYNQIANEKKNGIHGNRGSYLGALTWVKWLWTRVRAQVVKK